MSTDNKLLGEELDVVVVRKAGGGLPQSGKLLKLEARACVDNDEVLAILPQQSQPG